LKRYVESRVFTLNFHGLEIYEFYANFHVKCCNFAIILRLVYLPTSYKDTANGKQPFQAEKDGKNTTDTPTTTK